MIQNDTLTALKRVVHALNASGIVEPLKHIRQASKDRDASDFFAMLLGSFSEYSRLVREYEEHEHRVCTVMELDDLNNARFWADLLAQTRPDEKQLLKLYRTHGRVHFALNHLPPLIKLLEDKQGRVLRPFATMVPQGQSVLAQTITPLHGRSLVDTEQLSHGLEAVTSLYRACCMLGQKSPSPIGMQDWRSKPIGIFSVMMERQIRPAFDRVLNSIGGLVLEFNDEQQTSVLGMLHKLPELDAVDKLYNLGGLSQDAAEDIRHLLVNGSADYLLAGCIPASVPMGKRAAVPALVAKLERELQQQQLELQGALSKVDVEVSEADFEIGSANANYYDDSLDNTLFDGLEHEGSDSAQQSKAVASRGDSAYRGGTTRFEEVITEDDIDLQDDKRLIEESMADLEMESLSPHDAPEIIDDASFSAALENLIKERKPR